MKFSVSYSVNQNQYKYIGFKIFERGFSVFVLNNVDTEYPSYRVALLVITMQKDFASFAYICLPSLKQD